jgi:UDP-N-acetylglucosamine--N-acetylmuramyl-(pentapeptide) pyrophosphoryl-undecaprenol N-acetylglucosamine transferase
MSVAVSTRVAIPRLLMTGGGTGGGVYPALSVLAEVDTEPLWIGSVGGMEQAVVERAGVPFVGVAAGAVVGRGPVQLARSAVRNMRGFARARATITSFRPSVVLGTGGYVSFPALLAARSLGVPSALFVPDVEPGATAVKALAIRTLGALVDRVACTTAGSRHLPAGKVVATGYPVRAALRAWEGRRAEARAALGLPAEGRVLLVMGGSQGALRINRAIWDGLARLRAATTIVHVTGERWLAEAERHRDERYRPIAFAHEEMGQLFAAADLGVFRAGASVLGELPAFGLPGVLTPGSFAGGHQAHNARYLADHGAGVVFDDAWLDEPGRLVGVVTDLLADGVRLDAMAAASKHLDRADAARRVAELLAELSRRDVR